MKKAQPFQYGKHPAPRNWQEASDALRSQARPKRSSRFADLLKTVERLLQEKK